jgi:HD superfamily phosphohydrolase
MALLTRNKLTLNRRDYTEIEYIDRGGSGEVYKAKHEGHLVALKLFFPFFESRQLNLMPAIASTQLPGIVKQSIEFQQREYEFMSSVSHPNVVRAFDSGVLELLKSEQKAVRKDLGGIEGIDSAPLLVSEYVQGLPLPQAISEYSLTASELAYALSRIANALDYLHVHHSYMHTDIRGENVLIRADIREPVLIDFALCKNLNFDEVKPSQGTRLMGDWDLFPTLHESHPLKIARESGATREELKKLAFPALDLYQFGMMLKKIHDAANEIFEPREMRYLRVLDYELTQWDEVQSWEPGRLGSLVERLSPSESSPFGVPELAAPGVPERTLVIPGEVAVPLTPVIEPILATRSFRRLASVNQLSLLDIVYPGADYKRQVHVLYAYELARQFIAHLYSSPRFRYFFDQKAVTQLLLVVLLHDINHFPFLHTFQESRVDGLDRLELFDLLCSGEITGEKAAGEPSVYDLLAEEGLDPERFKRLNYAPLAEQVGHTDEIISSLLNSGVDVDKLSYLRLDAYFTGVPYGRAIDITTLLKAATIAPVDENTRFHLAFGYRALSALEHAIFTRYWNFRTIYWHHTNRAIMSMVLAVVRRLYRDGRLGLTDYLRHTAFRSDYDAVRYLDEEFERREGKDSILHGLDSDRSVIYRRLYTLHPSTDSADKSICDRLRNLTLDDELEFRKRLAEALGDVTKNDPREPTSDDVLVDVPKRDLDLGGAVYVESEGKIKSITRLSKPVEFVNSHYTELSQRTRIFIAPWLRESLDSLNLRWERDDIRKLLSTAIGSSSGPREVR